MLSLHFPVTRSVYSKARSPPPALLRKVREGWGTLSELIQAKARAAHLFRQSGK